LNQLTFTISQAYLDHREKDGYTQRKVDVYGTNAAGVEIVVEKDASFAFNFSIADSKWLIVLAVD